MISMELLDPFTLSRFPPPLIPSATEGIFLESERRDAHDIFCVPSSSFAIETLM